MLEKFSSFIDDNNLCQKKDKLLLAVSGGMDSVVMAHLFYEAGYEFSIAHCNFQLRGEESDGDAAFVERLSRDIFHVEYFYKEFDTANYTIKHKLSIQQAARELRYEWFEEIRAANNLSYIATAHHSDDQVETFLINLLRGTGITGLAGIPLKQNSIIRPMLFTGRKEIDQYAKQNGVMFQNDSSNESDKYLRNKIRLKLFPLLENINPAFRETISQSIQNLKGTEIVYKEYLQKLNLKHYSDNHQIKIEIEKLKTLTPGLHYLYELISEYGFNHSVCADVYKSLDSIPGKQFYSNTHTLIKDREYLIIYPNKNTMEESNEIIIEAGTTEVFNPFHLKFSEVENKGDQILKNGENVAMLNMDRLAFPLTIRKWQQGDFFYPLGMKSKKKLSDFFVDNKLSIKEKSDTWILCSCNEIVWVIGYRIDERFKINHRTKTICRIDIVK